MLILTRIERHLLRTRMAPTTFGRIAVGDPRLVADLRRGRRVGAALVDRIQAYLDEQDALLEVPQCRYR